MADRHNTIREGILAGFLSATIIAVWLFVVDMIAGHPLFTPTVLGRGVISLFGVHAGGHNRQLCRCVHHLPLCSVFTHRDWCCQDRPRRPPDTRRISRVSHYLHLL